MDNDQQRQQTQRQRNDQQDRDSGRIGDLKTDVAVIKNDVANMKLTLGTMAARIENFSYVKQSEYDDDKKNFVKQDEFKTIKALVMAVVTALIGLAFEVFSRSGH